MLNTSNSIQKNPDINKEPQPFSTANGMSLSGLTFNILTSITNYWMLHPVLNIYKCHTYRNMFLNTDIWYSIKILIETYSM